MSDDIGVLQGTDALTTTAWYDMMGLEGIERD